MARGWFALVVVIVLALSTVPADAGVDWSTGLVTADGIGVANRAAPTPASARGPARRLAEDAARARLRPQLPALPLADGTTLGAALDNPATKAAVDRALAHALTVAADPETDGSWKVTLAVPLEALRQALAGPRVVVAGDGGPAVVIVKGAGAKPAIGYKLGALGGAATLFVKSVPAWAKGAPVIQASGTKGDVIELAASTATAATLFVVVE